VFSPIVAGGTDRTKVLVHRGIETVASDPIDRQDRVRELRRDLDGSVALPTENRPGEERVLPVEAVERFALRRPSQESVPRRDGSGDRQ